MEGKYLVGQQKNAANTLASLKANYDEARERTKPFSFDRFEKNLNPVVAKSYSDLFSLFEVKINELNNAAQISTSRSYTTTLNWLKEFSKRKTLSFSELSPEWLQNFDRYLANKGRATGAIGVYMRNLRHIFNRAIEEGYVDTQLYPFGKKNYKIKSPAKTKKALTKSQLNQLVEYWRTAQGPEKKALDYWLFSLTSNGINMRDILEIKWKQVDSEHIALRRTKTSKSNTNQSEIVVHLNDINKEILERISESLDTQLADEYVFPDFAAEMNEEQKFEKNHDRRQYVTKYLKRIGKALEIPTKVSFETARHTFANTLKYSNVSPSIISNFMGHSSTATTDKYLGSIMADEEKQVIHDFVGGLSAEKKESVAAGA
ncbi:MAG: tyrosine-type recombinase/integrase [Bacteroidia bacterium]